MFKRFLIFVSAFLGLSFAQAKDKFLFDITPDSPITFGYKTNWFAIRTSDVQKVVKALGSKQVVVANWSSGIKKAYDVDLNQKTYPVFVSSEVEGWVFVVGSALPYPTDNIKDPSGLAFKSMFKALYSQFEDVQYYGSYRVVGFEAWAKAKSGEILREFSFADGSVLRNYGRMTPEEKELNFLDVNDLDPIQATNKIFSQADLLDEQNENLKKHGQEVQKTVRYSYVLNSGKNLFWENRVDIVGHSIPCEGDAQTVSQLWGFNPMLFDTQLFPKSIGYVIWIKTP